MVIYVLMKVSLFSETRVRLLACNRIKNRMNRCGWIVKVGEMCSSFVSAPSEEIFPKVCLTKTGYATSEKKSRLDFTMEPRGSIADTYQNLLNQKPVYLKKALWLCTMYFIY